MPELLDLPQEMIERIMEEVAGSQPINMQSTTFKARPSHLSFLLSLRSVHPRFRSALDPLIFRHFLLRLERGRSACLPDREMVGVDMLVSAGYNARATSLTILTTPFYPSIDRLAYFRQDRPSQGTLDQLLQTHFPRLENLSVIADHSWVESRCMRSWENIHVAPLPRLTSLDIHDPYLILYLPRIAQHSPLLQDVRLGGNCWHSSAVAAETWEEQGNELVAACRSMHVFATLQVLDFDGIWIQTCLRHLSLRARQVTILANTDPWSGSLTEQLAALASLCGSSDLRKLSIEVLWDETVLSTGEVDEYIAECESLRQSLLEECRKLCPDPQIIIGMDKVTANWEDLAGMAEEENDGLVYATCIMEYHAL